APARGLPASSTSTWADSGVAFGAIFSDGRTAARHDVTIALTPHGLAISGASIAPASWPHGDIRVLPSDRPTPLRLTRRSDDDVRLIVDDPDFRTALFDQCP